MRSHVVPIGLAAGIDRRAGSERAGPGLRILRPGLNHHIRIELRDDLPGARAGRKPADMIAMPVSGDDDVQLRATDLLDGLSDPQHVVLLPAAPGGRDAAEVHEHVPRALRIVECQEEAVSETDIETS